MNRFRNPQTQTGQIAILLVISLMTMVLTVSLVFNTGQQLHWKTKVQNAVDSAAVSHGSNVARSLNVISANNVAITQVFTLNVLMASLVPELTAASNEALKAAVNYAKGIGKYCPSSLNPIAAVLCGLNTAAAIRTAIIISDLYDIWDQIGSPYNPSKVNDARRMVQALESMNSQLYVNFSSASTTMSTNLGYMNGLDEPPIYIPGRAFSENKNGALNPQNYNGTLLPIEKTVTLSSGVGPVFSGVDEAIQNTQLCVTGYLASPIEFPPAFWNMQEHGYEFREGPFKVGRERFNRAIEKQVRRLEQQPKRIPGFSRIDVSNATDFEDIVNVAYPLACSLQQMVQVAALIPVGVTNITMYKATKPIFPFFESNRENRDWSVLAIARKEQSTGFAGRDIFVNPVRAHYAYAQVEVFNPLSYDLYTQDWTVKLQPANHLSRLSQSEVNAIADKFPEIEPALREGEPKFNSH